ncbi:Doublesex and mab-3-related transcription factor dmd-3 [Taenia crassiceps]|uniref:Doublesex and mab-3-related transcription factor dmd-3 n=1 Tax=Taenia crassiceps TaxID=6207 RepID=A0ABR4QSF0_9CEST
MVGLYQNSNNQLPDTTSQAIQIPTSLINSRDSNGSNVSNSQYIALDDFSLTQSTPEFCGGGQTSVFHSGDYAYQQSVYFRPLEAETFPADATTSYSAITPTSTPHPNRLGSIFKSVPIPNSSEGSESERPFSHNMICGQSSSHKPLSALPFNPIYSTLCLPTSQRLSFETVPQQLQLHQPMEGIPIQQVPTFHTSNKLRSQSSLMGLLGNRSEKIPESSLSLKDDEPKRLKTEESATDNAAPRSSYMCRKCRAHGRLIAVRQHKRNCPYKHCSCSVCSLVNYGRHIVARQIALYRDQKNHHTEDGVGVGRTKNGGGKSCSERTDLDEEGPHCRRCRNHGKTNPWKGHKKVCPFYYCICQQCILITLRKSNEKNLRK